MATDLQESMWRQQAENAFALLCAERTEGRLSPKSTWTVNDVLNTSNNSCDIN